MSKYEITIQQQDTDDIALNLITDIDPKTIAILIADILFTLEKAITDKKNKERPHDNN